MTYARARARGMGEAEHIGGNCGGSSLGIRVPEGTGELMCVSDGILSEAISGAGCVAMSMRCSLSSGARGREVCCPSVAADSLLAQWSIEPTPGRPAVASAPTLPSIPWMPSPFEGAAAAVETTTAWVSQKAAEVATTVASFTGGEAYGMPTTKTGAAAPGATPSTAPAAEPVVSYAGLVPVAGWVLAGLGAAVVLGLAVSALLRRGEE